MEILEDSAKEQRIGDEIRDVLYPIVLSFSNIKIRYKITTINSCENIPDKPIIYACNHSQFTDIPIAIKATGKRSYTLLGKQNLYRMDRIFFNLLGAIWVDRRDRKERSDTKAKILFYLKHGQSILWFPEGTWNLSDNLLMLPMRWGIIEVADKAQAQIVPMAIQYDRKTKECFVKFAEPIYGEKLTDYRKGIQMLRNIMATLRWELMGEFSNVVVRDEVGHQRMEVEKNEIIKEYPPLDWEYEKSVIYKK
ncbi:MAG: lysophospholipid acyltransferase family protein [Lachnospiraceae bacterium]|nr:lysophospholipid acyltransferase family protein [Lachnospiraceae bacterium]